MAVVSVDLVVAKDRDGISNRFVGFVVLVQSYQILSFDVPGFFALKWKCNLFLCTQIISVSTWRVPLLHIVQSNLN